MRTTLEIDDVVLAAARSLARTQGISLGSAVSELARRGLNQSARTDISYSPFPVLIGDGTEIVTDDLVNAHRDG
ncbi:MAG: hypothetical protein ACK5H2_10285 [Beutenbergiaceae bacterium]